MKENETKYLVKHNNIYIKGNRGASHSRGMLFEMALDKCRE